WAIPPCALLLDHRRDLGTRPAATAARTADGQFDSRAGPGRAGLALAGQALDRPWLGRGDLQQPGRRGAGRRALRSAPARHRRGLQRDADAAAWRGATAFG